MAQACSAKMSKFDPRGLSAVLEAFARAPLTVSMNLQMQELPAWLAWHYLRHYLSPVQMLDQGYCGQAYKQLADGAMQQPPRHAVLHLLPQQDEDRVLLVQQATSNAAQFLPDFEPEDLSRTLQVCLQLGLGCHPCLACRWQCP